MFCFADCLLIAAAGMDSRGVLAFRTPICDYEKLLF
jgi:hypothetical protein